MPVQVVERWLAERRQWILDHGIDPAVPGWEAHLRQLSRADALTFADFVSERWESQLDVLHGACVLRRPALAEIVAKSLRHLDGDRYVLDDFVVMPNHVHLLAAFPTEEAQLAQCDSWKHYTAAQINRALGRRGRFWQQDGFDHLVRSVEQFEHFRRYIADNPLRAHLQPGEFIHYRAKRTPLAPREDETSRGAR
jgi:REP element-mobilizing transposase RayT